MGFLYFAAYHDPCLFVGLLFFFPWILLFAVADVVLSFVIYWYKNTIFMIRYIEAYMLEADN